MTVLVAIYGEHPWNIPASYVEGLQRRFGHHTFAQATCEQELMARIHEAEVGFLGRLKVEALTRAERLVWVHSPAAGVGSLLFPEMLASRVVLTNSRGLHGPAMAEHVIGVTIALFRHFHSAMRAQPGHRWAKADLSDVRMLRGRRMGIIGLGAVGTAVAAAASALGMHVIATRRHADRPRPVSVEEVYPPSGLPRLLETSDVVVVAAPHTHETGELIRSREVRLMKRDAILVNIARGRLVSEGDLARELARGTIAGAALDVFEHEPLGASSPLWDLPNVIITPHTSGYREDYWEAAVELFAQNLGRFDRGEPLLNVVDKQAGY